VEKTSKVIGALQHSSSGAPPDLLRHEVHDVLVGRAQVGFRLEQRLELQVQQGALEALDARVLVRSPYRQLSSAADFLPSWRALALMLRGFSPGQSYVKWWSSWQ